jgi:MFS family permease
LNQRSVQAHIEGSPLSSMQWLVWALATAGKFFEGLIVFMGGIALPLVSEQFQLTALDRGLVTAAPLVGILIGALGLGGLADRLGRRPVFIAEMLLLVVGLVAAALSPNGACFAASLGVVGLALGADYPAAHLVISESIPVAMRGRLVLGAFSCQALGAVLGTALAAQLLGLRPELGTWRGCLTVRS